MLGLIGLIVTFYFGYLKSKIEDDKVFKELFDSFSKRYDGKMNDLINELKTTKSDRLLTVIEKNIVIDYFNLCAEEYLWRTKKRIPDEVWNAWKAGIEENLKIPQIIDLYKSEMATENGRASYYRLDKELKTKSLNSNTFMNNSKCIFKLINNDTVDNAILSGIFDSFECKLDKQVKGSIMKMNFHLFLSTGPACTTKVTLNSDFPIKNLIVLDKTLLYDLLKFNHFEVAAAILHEVGHIMNKVPEDKKEDTEFYADDFVRTCGFGCHLVNGFNKYLKTIETYTDATKGYYFFAKEDKQKQIIDMFEKRMKRIEINEDLLLNLVFNEVWTSI